VLQVHPHENAAKTILDFMKMQGGEWGARPDVITRATYAMNEAVEAISLVNPDLEEMDLEVSFDEFNLNTDIRYRGTLLEIPKTRPSKDAIAEDEKGMACLAGYMLHRYADKVSTQQKGDVSHVFIHFDH